MPSRQSIAEADKRHRAIYGKFDYHAAGRALENKKEQCFLPQAITMEKADILGQNYSLVEQKRMSFDILINF